MAATCMAVCKGSRKKIRGIFISSCHLPVAVECDIVILSEPGPIPQAPVGQFCRHNLSPRGDGNQIEPLAITPQRTQLIPARGRKQGCRCGDGGDDPDTTYPREGTETRPPRDSTALPRHNLSPRGDGNISPLVCRSALSVCNLSPRGDGNIFVQLNRVGVDRHNLSPRGDGNLLLLCSSVFAVEPDTTYPREGTETF